MHHAQESGLSWPNHGLSKRNRLAPRVMFGPCAQSQEVHQRRHHVEVGAGAVNNASADVGAPRHEAQSAFLRRWARGIR